MVLCREPDYSNCNSANKYAKKIASHDEDSLSIYTA